MILEYLDFRIKIDNEFQVVASSNELTVTSKFEIDRDEMKKINTQLESQDETDIENITDDWRRLVGKLLYDNLFTEKLQNLYKSSLDVAQKKGAGIRFRIESDSPEIANYPFEMMCKDGTFISTKEDVSITRSIPSIEYSHVDLGRPLRILIIGSNPSINELPAVKVDREVKAIKGALDSEVRAGNITIDESNGNVDEIMSKLQERKFNIIHFIGHGVFENDEGFLALETNDGGLRKANPELIKDVFGNQSQTCDLLVLNSCQGAMTSTSKAFIGIAPSLLIRGFKCVLAMRYSISNNMAIQFSQKFYSNITSISVDEVLRKLRELILATQSNPRDFVSPVLFLNSEKGIIFSNPNKAAIDPRWANQFLGEYYDVISHAAILNDGITFMNDAIRTVGDNFIKIKFQFFPQLTALGRLGDKIRNMTRIKYYWTDQSLMNRVSNLETLITELKNAYLSEDTEEADLVQKIKLIQQAHGNLQKELKDLYSEIINGSVVS